MLLHVPTVPKDSILHLLKLHPFPLPLNKNYSIIPMVQDDLLAISAEFNRYSAQLSSVDLLGCHSIKKILLLFNVFVTFICSLVALGLVTLVILWYLSQDYVLRLPCFQSCISPRIRSLIDTTTPASSDFFLEALDNFLNL